MTLAIVNAATAVATLAVLGASVIAGVIQLRHMRASNELEAVLAVAEDFRSRALQDALSYVQDQLPERMQDTAYRAELSTQGYIDPRRHPEMALCNWFNEAGALVQGGFLKEDLFLDSFGRLVAYYWVRLGPVIALLRQTRGPAQYEGFEYLAYRTQMRAGKHHRRAYPRGGRRLPVVDPWLASDFPRRPNGGS